MWSSLLANEGFSRSLEMPWRVFKDMVYDFGVGVKVSDCQTDLAGVRKSDIYSEMSSEFGARSSGSELIHACQVRQLCRDNPKFFSGESNSRSKGRGFHMVRVLIWEGLIC